jgi:hypothetical protein
MAKTAWWILFGLMIFIVCIIFLIIFCRPLSKKPKRKNSAYPFCSVDVWPEVSDEVATPQNEWKTEKPIVFVDNRPDLFSLSGLQRLLNQRSTPVILIFASNSDHYTPLQKGSREDRLIHTHPMLKKIYAKNALYPSPRLGVIPIGPKWQYRSYDLYGEDKTRNRTIFLSFAKNAKEVQKNWDRPKKKGIVVAIGDAPGRKHHERVLTSSTDIIVKPKDKLELKEFLTLLGEHQFVFSPPGFGYDCHRHWESLLVGSIPVVIGSETSDELFQDLPVWIVKSYKEVTNEAMDRVFKDFHTKSWNFERLFLDFWREKIYSEASK